MATHDDPAAEPVEDRPFRAVGFLLSQLGLHTAKRFAERLEPLGLHPRQFAVLRHVSAAEGESQQAIGEALGIPASRMVAFIDELEDRGLVERRPHPTDRRRHTVYLTPSGRETLERALQIGAEHERDLTADLDPAEREQLIELLARVAAARGLRWGVHPALTHDKPGWPKPDA